MTRLDTPQAPARFSILQHPVVLVGGAMIVVQILFRGWALYGSFFYTDDYRLLSEAQGRGLDATYLVKPFDSQFMPLGRLAAWLIADQGHLNWPLAATITLAVQLLASIACLSTLITMFGPRRGILAPLGIYLTSAITMPAFMWWAAGLNQLPWQLVFFVSVNAWIRYLRTNSSWWLLATTLVVALGLASYVKTVLVLIVLAAVMLGWFSSGSLPARMQGSLRSYWPAGLTLSALTGVFALFYLTNVPQVFSESEQMNYTASEVAPGLADRMLGSSLTTGVLGGPWRWLTSNPPTGYADPPVWSVGLSWTLIATLGLMVFLLRERTGRAFLLMGAYAFIAYVLVLTSRARVVGELIGTEYRYLTDVLPVVVLAVSLACMPLLGALESSQPRVRPMLHLRIPPWALPAVTLALCISGVWSTASYARIWHSMNPGATYVETLRGDLPMGRPLDMAPQVVPSDVVPGFSFPYNSTTRFLPLVSEQFRFPESTDELVVVDDQGHLRRALIQSGATSPVGPVADCGWPVRSEPVVVPLSANVFDFEWWIRIGYVASAASPVTVEAGRSLVQTNVRAGIGSLYVRVTGSMDSVRIAGVNDATTLCVDTIEVGNPVGGAPL